MTLDQLGFCDRESEKAGSFAAAALHGLSKVQKILPCEFFYDARGSSLFEAITREPEYYPTRTEAAILAGSANEIARDTAHGSVLVEFGSGSSVKTEILLLALRDLAAYVPIDVSPSALESARARLVHRFPGLFVYCVMGDFRAELVLPANIENKTRLGFFPGSTIGNFTPLEAARLLRAFALNLGPRGRLIIGVDLRKDVSRLVAAYNDAAGVTAAFNLNLLTRANRELGADFNLAAFEHEAIFNTRMSRIEMHLVSTRRQSVSLLGRRFDFRPGETIHTENSHKYSVREFQDLARGAGWTPRRVWTDPEDLFSVHELAAKA
jgi:dimethylhistidine N-methyltransferase